MQSVQNSPSFEHLTLFPENTPSSPKTNAMRTFVPLCLLSSDTGGAREDRTPDPLLAKQVLSQLSYGPGGQRTEN